MPIVRIVALLVAIAPSLAWGKGNDPEWRMHIRIADSELRKRDFLQAEGHLKHAWKLAEQFGEDDPRLAYTAVKLGGVYVELDQQEPANKLFMFAIPIFKRQHEDGWRQLAYAYRQMGDLRYQQRNFAHAREYYLQALELHDSLKDEKSLARAATLFGLARVARHRKQIEPAETYVLEAIKLVEQSRVKPDNAASILAELGQVHLLKKDLRRAETLFQEALKRARKAHPETHREVAYILECYAKVLRQTGRGKLADEYAKHSQAIKKEVF